MVSMEYRACANTNSCSNNDLAIWVSAKQDPRGDRGSWVDSDIATQIEMSVFAQLQCRQMGQEQEPLWFLNGGFEHSALRFRINSDHPNILSRVLV